MSPHALRRYRAERLLERDFEGLRGQVLASVHSRLYASGVRGELVDLESCYAAAWQGLYAATLAGQLIANPGGWLVMVTFRRALDEHRALVRRMPAGESEPLPEEDDPAGSEPDLVQELEDRRRLRHVFEALRGGLSARESEAAVLCYLQGLSREEAAERMGISPASMRRLMDGRGPSRPGVASKVGGLLETIDAGSWCEEQVSLMRGLAFSVLDPAGERHRLALAHARECSACRAYVVSLRGLAAVLPPLALPLGAWGSAGAAGGAGAGVGASGGAGTGAAGGAATGSAVGSLGASAGAGAGGMGLLAGGKLAAGCLIALGLGAGCITLALHPGSHPSEPARGHVARLAGGSHRSRQPGPAAIVATQAAAQPASRALTGARPRSHATARQPARVAAVRAQREFGLEHPAGGRARARSRAPQARTAATREFAPVQSDGAPAGEGAQAQAAPRAGTASRSNARSAASREFGIE